MRGEHFADIYGFNQQIGIIPACAENTGRLLYAYHVL